MATVKMGSLFPAELVREMYSKVKGHSSLAKIANADPIAFTGTDVFVFDLDGSVSIVGESAVKPAGSATVTSKQIRPVKVVYQARVTDEFMKASEEKRLNILTQFADGFAKRVGAGLDKMAIHGINPATGSAATGTIGDNYFDYKCASTAVTYNASTPDANLESAIAVLETNEYAPSGIIVAPIMRSALGSMTNSADGFKYPGFQFGGTADLGGVPVDSNITVGSASGSNDRALVGDFNAFKWGFAENIPLEIIEYGNPDGGSYDLKQANQILLRSEAYIGWGILDANAFCLVCKDGTPIVT